MSERLQVQANPTLDKMAARLGLAGTGLFGPVLKGLGGTVKIDLDRGEVLDYVKIFSQGPNEFSNTLSGTFESLGESRRRWSCPIVFGVDTDYGVSGGRAIRNFLEWRIKRKVARNPSGPPAGEKAWSHEDTTAMRGLDDTALRKDRSWFGSRTYYQALADSVYDPLAPEVSGCTWRDDNSTLYFVSDNGAITVTDRDGNILQSIIGLPGALGFYDTEAIAYLGSDRFAILDEGSFGSRPPRLILFHLKQGADTVEARDIHIHTLSKVEEFAGGNGAEGLAYDPATGLFYVGTQPTADGEGGLWEVDILTKDTDDEPSQRLLYRWYDVVVATGHLGAGALLGDLYYSRDMGGGYANSSIFCHFRTPDAGGPSTQRKIIQLDIESGQVVGVLNHGLSGKWEAMTFDPDSQSIFFAREGGGQNFRRFDHDDFEETEIFRRQFFVKDVPLRGGIYLAGQEAQQGEAWVFMTQNEKDTARSPYIEDATFGINVLPTFNDEFFTQHEYRGNLTRVVQRVWAAGTLYDVMGRRPPNRYAQTLRNVGGVRTVEIFADGVFGDPVIPECEIEDLAGYYWENPSYGLHTITARVRADWGSPHYVDITGYVRFRQLPCPITDEEGA